MPIESLPQNEQGTILPLVPAIEPLAVTYDATISASTEIVFDTKASLIEVTAIDKGIFMRWGASDASSSAFSEYIAAGATRQYAIPTGVLAANFIEEAATAKLVLIQK